MNDESFIVTRWLPAPVSACTAPRLRSDRRQGVRGPALSVRAHEGPAAWPEAQLCEGSPGDVSPLCAEAKRNRARDPARQLAIR